MANCGLPRLVIVQAPWRAGADPPEEARRMASGADWILESARHTETVEEALAPYVLAAAATARARADRSVPWLDHRAGAARLLEAAHAGPVAAVFGPEDRGLSAPELALCAIRIRIPSSAWHESFNLAQAVLLVSHEVFVSASAAGVSGPAPADPSSRAVALDQLDGLCRELTRMLGRVGFLNPQNPDHIMDVVRHVLIRARMDPREVRTFRGIVRQVDWALDHPGRVPAGDAPAPAARSNRGTSTRERGPRR
jgi:tRNA/rRNA methyltransferase